MMSKELRNLNIKDLEKLIIEKKLEITDFSMKLVKGSEKNVRKIGVLKKDLARLLTVLNELKIVGEVEEI